MSKGKISPMKNGPLIVEGDISIKKANGESVDFEGNVALCRCGESNKKPFCDGSHAKVNFDDQKLESSFLDQREDYVGEGITIHDNRSICAHAGFCTSSLKSVFRVDKEPFIDPNGATKEEIIEAIDKCPSGALSYSVDGEEQVFSIENCTTFIAPNGPYAFKGDIEVEGIVWGQGAAKEKFDLCRCGESKNKPFCDGSHWNKHFDKEAPDPKG